jgi:ABC-type polysaccharide/polyol phosphate export permease
MSYKDLYINSFKDIFNSLQNYALVALLAWQDIKQRYRRSYIGPFWLTLSTAVMIGGMGLVFSQIFKTPLQDYLPFLAVGMILWAFVSTSVSEGCMSFIHADAIIKQLPIPMFTHILRVITRNIFIFLHHLILIPIVILIAQANLQINIFTLLLGFLILVLNLVWIILLLATLCTRFRDLSQIVNSGMQIIFYVTPIMWQPKLMSHQFGLLVLNLNPIYHLFELVRAPLLGYSAQQINWMVGVGLALLGWSLSLLVFGRYRHRIAYWL